MQCKSSKRYKESLVKQLQRERDQAALRAQKPGSTEQRTPVQTVRPGAQEKPLPNTFPNLVSCFSEQACYEIKLYFMFWPPRFPPVGWEGGALDTCMEQLQKANTAPRCQGMEHSMCCCSHCSCMGGSLSAVTCSCLMFYHLQKFGEERNSILCRPLTVQSECQEAFLHCFLPSSIMRYTD